MNDDDDPHKILNKNPFHIFFSVSFLKIQIFALSISDFRSDPKAGPRPRLNWTGPTAMDSYLINRHTLLGEGGGVVDGYVMQLGVSSPVPKHFRLC